MMMKFLCVICIFVIVVGKVHGDVWIIPADGTPGHPGYCNSDETGPMKKGETRTVKDCVRAHCNGDGTIDMASCGLIMSPCGLEDMDLTKDYPDCCPQSKICPP